MEGLITDVLSNDTINNLNIICAATGQKLTDEQMVFASDFTRPTISFSDAGTGKTYAVAVGLVHTQTAHKVLGREICVMSFTREAAREVSSRYDTMTKFKMLASKVNFSTFHSLCLSVLKDAWGSVSIKDFDYDNDLSLLRQYAEGAGLENVSNFWLKKLLIAMNSLNSSFTFDPNEMKLNLKFKELKISVEVFNNIRKEWAMHQMATHTIPKGDIPIHCYNQLMRNKIVRKKYYHMFKVLVIDEFQDMSVLYVKIMTELCDSPVVIGDMKQQIYAFNGASDSIEKEFFTAYPDARVCPLTQSFRCKDEIVAEALKVIAPNKIGDYGFKGIGTGGMVGIIRNRELSIDDIAEQIRETQLNVETMERKDVMFLFRNNFSGMTVMDTLYRHGARFRSNNFKKVMDISIFKELCIVLDAIDHSDNEEKVWSALRLFGEFSYTQRSKCGVLNTMQLTGKDWLNCGYIYKTVGFSNVIELFKECKLAIDSDKSCGQLFATLLPIYENFIIEGKWWKLDFQKEFYFNLVAPIVNDKPYRRMIAEEFDKENKNIEAMEHFDGVRCFTIHSAKGLEAEEIYIIDCEEGIIPSKKNLEAYRKAKCEFEAARTLRNERNLLYVAITRAKRAVHICYTSTLATLISSPQNNEYLYLDEVYETADTEFYNVKYFLEMFNYKKSDEEVFSG